MKAIYINQSAAADLRALAERSPIEHGGALVGSAEHGDVYAFVAAPDDIVRSPVVVELKGAPLRAAVACAVEQHPGAAFVGYAHVHLGLEALSAGDHDQIRRLHDHPGLPAAGILAMLAVKRRIAPVLLKAWLSPAPNVVEEVEIREVEDAAEARSREARELPAPQVRIHVVGASAGVARLEAEFAALDQAGYAIDAELVERGIELRLTHGELRGMLVLLLPPEGWERPPRVELVRDHGRRELVASAIANFCAAWSSAFTLTDLVTFVRGRGIWPKRGLFEKKNGKPAREVTS